MMAKIKRKGFKRKKGKKQVRMSKAEMRERKEVARRHIDREQEKRQTFSYDQERFAMTISTLKRKLLEIVTKIDELIIYNKNPEKKQDFEYAREYTVFARERLGDTEFFSTDVDDREQGKSSGKLRRRRGAEEKVKTAQRPKETASPVLKRRKKSRLKRRS